MSALADIINAQLKPEPHPVAVWLPPEQLERLGSTRRGQAELYRLHEARQKFIAAERANPFENLVEPPIWLVCDALLGFSWTDAAAERRGWGAGWGRRMRKCLGFERPVDTMLICGCNRGGKSQYAGNRSMRLLNERPGRECWAFHETLDMSIAHQQPIFFRYLPPELRAKNVMTRTLNVTWKQKTGFGEGKFVLANGSRQTFKAYAMGEDALEGAELDMAWCDELVPAEWVKTLKFRVANRSGKVLVTFTPVDGYSDAVAMFQDGAQVCRQSTAWLLPLDGGAPDVARQLRLSAAELAEWRESLGEPGEVAARASWSPASRTEDCNVWLTEDAAPEDTGGREFERLPRVLKPAWGAGRAAVVFFHLGDNPYGNPLGVWEAANG